MMSECSSACQHSHITHGLISTIPVYMIIIDKLFLNNMCLDLNPEESPHGWTIVSNQLPY